MTESPNRANVNNSSRWVVIAAPIAIMAVIFALSSRSNLPDLDGGHDFQSVSGHFAIYAALGSALTLLFRSLGWSRGQALFAAVVIATLYGITDEFHQSFVPNRHTDSFDVLVDFIGATFGSVAMLALSGRRPSPISSSSDAAPDRPVDESS